MPSPLIYARDYDHSGVGRQRLSFQARAGTLTRIRQGVYFPAEVWRLLPWWEQYRFHIEAAVGKGRTERILACQSAAAIWGIPVIGKCPEVVLLASPGHHGQRRADIRWIASEILEPLQSVDGFTVTSRAQTAVDIAARLPFEQAVPAMDHVLRPDKRRRLPGLGKGQLHALADKLPTKTKAARAHRVVDFGDARSESAGESLSRAQMFLFHFPSPELQHPFYDTNGLLLGITDFYWKEASIAGEFDGSVKYSRGEYLKGQSPADAVEKEKAREDSIRAAHNVRFARWTWRAAMDPEGEEPRGVVELLRAAGLEPDRWNRKWPGMGAPPAGPYP
jgi:hypothetical protein